MGVTIWFVIFVTLGGTFLELKLYKGLPEGMAKAIRKNPVWGLPFSIGISLLFGKLFGVHGLVAGSAAMLITCVTSAYYVLHSVVKRERGPESWTNPSAQDNPRFAPSFYTNEEYTKLKGGGG